MLGRFIWNPIGALVVGVLSLGLSVAIATGVDVTCSKSAVKMAEGVTCQSRSGETVTYDAWQTQQRQYAMIGAGLGGVLVIGGAIAMVVRRKRRAAESAQSASLHA